MAETKPNLDIQRQLIDTIIGLPPGGFNKPLTYALMKSGLFMVRMIPTAIVSQRIGATTDIPTITDDLQEGIFPTVPLIPWDITSSILAFFKAVYEKYKSEVYVSVWLDPVTKTYSVHVPKQRVSGGSVNHIQDHDTDGNLIHVLDVHSHASMSAFFSGTDDRDESRADRFYGVIGHLDKPTPAWKFRIRFNGQFHEINPSVILEPSTETVQVNINMIDALTATKDGSTNGKVNFEVEVKPFDGTFPPAWMDQIDNTTSYVLGGGTMHPFRGLPTTTPSIGGTGTSGTNKFPKLSKKDRKKGVQYVYIGGACYREYPDGRREEVFNWPGLVD